jgi:hypothetical protein
MAPGIGIERWVGRLRPARGLVVLPRLAAVARLRSARNESIMLRVTPGMQMTWDQPASAGSCHRLTTGSGGVLKYTVNA